MKNKADHTYPYERCFYFFVEAHALIAKMFNHLNFTRMF